ncbi:MAG: alpha/beta fold hydrolase [Gammaproteobacteria bacterium]|nr:alpha/beta fold hydrolase [Gammaproteobacteria bacterium]
MRKWGLATLLLALLAFLFFGRGMGPSFPEVDPSFLPDAKRVEGIAVYRSPNPKSHLPTLLMIHGTPGNWAGYEWYLANVELQQHFNIVAVDRPGFGASVGSINPDLRAQTEAILAAVPDQRLIVVGHSLGGPIALWSALLEPDRVEHAFMLAASLAPEYEAPKWFNQLADTWLAKQLLPTVWQNANNEVLALPSELAKLQRAAKTLTVPVTIIQGDLDELVHKASPESIAEYFPASVDVDIQHWREAGHFLLWEQKEAVAAQLKSVMSESK